MSNGFPAERFLTFFGSIRQPATTNLRVSLCAMVNEGATKITILFASDGGSTDDGIALHTYLTALPVDLTMHAVGIVASVAIPIFLAAPTRVASRNARFFFHEYSWTHGQPTVVTQTTMAEQSMLLSDALKWTQEIVKARTRLTDSDFDAMKLFDQPVIMTPDDAAAAGLVARIAEPSIPACTRPLVVL
ncbi:MAG: ATP-dependent Clp protease proteolytic subunit [Alphaproteobacteria bacterium]